MRGRYGRAPFSRKVTLAAEFTVILVLRSCRRDAALQDAAGNGGRPGEGIGRPRISMPGPPLVRPTAVPPLLVMRRADREGGHRIGLDDRHVGERIGGRRARGGGQRPAADAETIVADIGGHEDAAAGQRQAPLPRARLPAEGVLNRRLLTVVAEAVGPSDPLVTSTLLPAV